MSRAGNVLLPIHLFRKRYWSHWNCNKYKACIIKTRRQLISGSFQWDLFVPNFGSKSRGVQGSWQKEETVLVTWHLNWRIWVNKSSCVKSRERRRLGWADTTFFFSPAHLPRNISSKLDITIEWGNYNLSFRTNNWSRFYTVGGGQVVWGTLHNNIFTAIIVLPIERQA